MATQGITRIIRVTAASVVAALGVFGSVAGAATSVVGDQPPGSVAGELPATKAKAMAAGAMKSVPPKVVWGGAEGKLLKAGKTVTAKLGKAGGVPASATSLLAQVTVTGANKPGSLAIGPVKGRAAQAIAFDKGATSTTMLLATSPGRRIALKSTASAQVRISVVGFAAAAKKGKPAPGGSLAIRPSVVLDSASKRGGALPRRGNWGEVFVVGKGGVPTEGVRAVWLSVQTRGASSGSITFRKPGGGTMAGAADVLAKKWWTSLVLAPVDAQGQVSWKLARGSLAAIRIAVVGWVAETDLSSATTTADGGIVPVSAKAVKVKALGSTRASPRLFSAKVTGGQVPSAVARVLLRVSLTSTKGWSLGAGASASAARKAMSGSATTRASVLLPADVGSGGKVVLAVGEGARVASVRVVGYLAGTLKSSKAKKPPSLTFAAVNGGKPVDLALTPRITLSGTVSDAQSGVRSVRVAAGSSTLGSARVDASVRPARWTMDVCLPEGSVTLVATATNQAGSSARATQSTTVRYPKPEEIVVNERVQTLPSSTLTRIVRVTGSSITFAGTKVPATPGAIIAAGVSPTTPGGLLRRVTAVEKTAATVVLSTKQASLTDAYYQLSVHEEDIALGEQARQGELKPAGLDLAMSESFAFEVSATQGIASVSARGEVAVKTTLWMDIDIGVESWSPKTKVVLNLFEIKVSSERTVKGSVSIGAEVKLEKKTPLASIELGTVTIMAGPVPIIIVNSLEPYVTVGVSVSGKHELSVTQTEKATAGATCRRGAWSTFKENTSSLVPAYTKATGGSVYLAVGLELEAKLYGVAGPTVGIEVKAALEGEPRVEKQTQLFVDVTATVTPAATIGVEVSILDNELVKWETKFEFSKRTFGPWTLGPWTLPAPGTPSPRPTDTATPGPRPPTAPPSDLTVSPSSVLIGSSVGATASTSVSTTLGTWWVSSCPSWLTCTKGAYSLSLATTSASGSTAVQGSVVIAASSTSSPAVFATVTVTQAAGHLTVTPNPVSIGSAVGSTATVSVSTNQTSWWISACPSGLTCTKGPSSVILQTTSGGAPSGTLVVAAGRSESSQVFSRTVTVTRSGVSAGVAPSSVLPAEAVPITQVRRP